MLEVAGSKNERAWLMEDLGIDSIVVLGEEP